MKRLVRPLLAACLIGATMAPAARAGVSVQRTASENPVQEIAKATIYGGLAGLVMGGAIALANDGKNTSHIIRWSVAGGTFFGFAYGVYYVSTRPPGRALIEVEEGKLRLGALSPELALDAGVPLSTVLKPEVGVRVSLVAARF
jgi:hypothetical protein